MTAETTLWTESFRVRTYEINAEGRAPIQSICNYLQEAAGNHAEALGLSVHQLFEQGLTWVLARLHVQVTSFPRWRDLVRVETWPSGVKGLYATREFVVLNETGDHIARATSAWLMVNVARRRPVRIPAFVSELRWPQRTRAVDDAFPTLAAPAEVDHERPFRVRYSDLDVNAHVNNVHFVEWVVESLPQAFVTNHHLRSVELHYTAEAGYDDLVLSRAGRAPERPAEAETVAEATSAFHHQLLRQADGRALALARTRWTPHPGAPS